MTKTKKLYIGYFNNWGQDTAEIFVSEHVNDEKKRKKDFIKYLKNILEFDIEVNHIDGIYPLDDASDSKGVNYKIKL